MRRTTGSLVAVPPPRDDHRSPEELREVVPARAVLTELARGFLLVRENDRERAVRFARTFLRERSESWGAATPTPYPVPAGQQSLGRHPLGGIERPDLRPPR